MFLYKKGFELSSFNVNIKAIKQTEERKYFAIQVNQSKYMQANILSIYTFNHSKICAFNQFFLRMFLVEDTRELPNLNLSIYEQ